MGGCSDGLVFELVAESPDIAEIEVERKVVDCGNRALVQLGSQVGVEVLVDGTFTVFAANAPLSGGDVVLQDLGERSGGIAHDRQALGDRVGGRAIEPEARLASSVEILEQALRVGLAVDSLPFHAQAPTANLAGVLGCVGPGVGVHEFLEVHQHRFAPFGQRRLGVELDAPVRPGLVPDRHDHSVRGPRGRFDVGGHIGDCQ